jgi:hypothetical protein
MRGHRRAIRQEGGNRRDREGAGLGRGRPQWALRRTADHPTGGRGSHRHPGRAPRGVLRAVRDCRSKGLCARPTHVFSRPSTRPSQRFWPPSRPLRPMDGSCLAVMPYRHWKTAISSLDRFAAGVWKEGVEGQQEGTIDLMIWTHPRCQEVLERNTNGSRCRHRLGFAVKVSCGLRALMPSARPGSCTSGVRIVLTRGVPRRSCRDAFGLPH